MAANPDQPTRAALRSGRCYCGAARFRAAGDPLWVAYCHCADCRRHTASPVTLYAGFRRPDVEFTATALKVRQSSPGVERAFCNECGTPMYYAGHRWPEEIHLFVATFEHPEAFVPQSHAYWNERLPGFDVRDDLPRT